MKKEYISPEVEMTKFEEIEEIMDGSSLPGLKTEWDVEDIPLGKEWE